MGILDELNDKLGNMLDNELKTCHNYSSSVMIIYKRILTMLKCGGDFEVCRDDLNMLEECVLKEYNEFEKLLMYDKASLVPRTTELLMSEVGPVEDLRFRNKLQFTMNIFSGYKINARDLDIVGIPTDMRFDVYSALLSLIYIKVFKAIKDRLDSLVCDNTQDDLFLKDLYKEFDYKLLYRCSSNDLFEIIGLFNGMDVDKFPDITMDKFMNKLSQIYGDNDIDEHINMILFNLIVGDISKIKGMQQINNNPEDVFDYLYFTIKINVIMSYMNKKFLQKLFDYCSNIDFKNEYIRKDVKRLVRTLLDM